MSAVLTRLRRGVLGRELVARPFAGWSVAQWWLRSGQVAATGLALLAIGQAGSGVGPWLVPAALLSVWAFFSPDSTGPAVLMGVLVLGWWNRVDDPVSGWLLLFAAAVFLVHVLGALAASGPPAADFGREVGRRWLLSTTAVLAAVTVMWTLLMMLRDADVPGSTWRLVGALLAVALLAGWLRARSVADLEGASVVRRSDQRQ